MCGALSIFEGIEEKNPPIVELAFRYHFSEYAVWETFRKLNKLLETLKF